MADQTDKQLQDALADGRLSRRQFIKRAAAIGLSLPTISAVLAACGGDGAATPTAEQQQTAATATSAPAATATAVPSDSGELDQVVWVSPRGSLEVMDDFNLWIPVEMGYFEDLGLSVELQPGPLEALAVTRLVAQNQADVGYPSPGVFLSSLDAGMDLVMPWEMMVGQTFNFALPEDSPIESVQGLEGATIALGSEGWSVIVDPILVEAGVDPESVEYLNAGNQWAQAAESGEADAALAWQGLTAQWKAQGRNLKYLIGQNFSDHPSNGYCIRATDLEDEQMVDLWERFFTGVSMGFEFARVNPRAGAQITYSRFPGLQEQMEPQLAMDSMIELADVYYGSYRMGNGYGWADIDAWQDYIDIVLDLGQIENEYDAGNIITNELIEEANNFDVDKVHADAEAFELNENWQQVDAPDVLAEAQT